MEEGRFRASGVRREVEKDEARWVALEAWRGRGGRGLCYFLRLSGDAPAADDREDRRAVLEAATRLEDLDGEELTALLEAGTGLTATERRFVDGEGAAWLAQNVGPVWAEGDVAAGLTGILFTRLADGERTRASAPGGHVGGLSDDELREHLARALRRLEAAAEGAPGPGDGTEPGETGDQGPPGAPD